MSGGTAGDEGLPVRPYVPPSAFLACGMCVSAAAVLQAGWLRHAKENVVPWGVVGLLIAFGLATFVIGVRIDRRAGVGGSCRGRAMLFLGVGLVIAAVSSCVWLLEWRGKVQSVREAGGGVCLLAVEGDPSAGESGYSSTVCVIDAESGARRGEVRMTGETAYESGASLLAVCRITELDDSDWARSRFMKGEVASARIVSVLEERAAGGSSLIDALRARALRLIDPGRDEYRALVGGTLCGRTTELNATEAHEDFSTCGLTHLIAVSGSHFAYIAAMLERLLRRTRMVRGAQSALLLSVMVGYVAFTGWAPSAIRSVSMVALAMSALMGRRRAHAPSGLALATAFLVALDPGAVYDLGFQLSVISVLFIVVFGRYVSYGLMLLRLPAGVADALSLTLVAQWATLPLTLPMFGELSVVAPLANLVAGPLMSGLLVCGIAGVGVATVLEAVVVPFGVAGGVASVALAAPDALARLSVFVARALADIPFASVPIDAPGFLVPMAYGTALLVYVRWGAVRVRHVLIPAIAALLIFGCHVLRWTCFAPPEIVVLDVGQGDAILIRDGVSTLLVDAGIDGATREALVRNRVFALDAVLVTHWDRDHWGGLPAVLGSIDVGRLYVAQGASGQAPLELADGPEMVELVEGDVIRVGWFRCKMVWPDRTVEGDENEDSVVLGVSYDGAAGRLEVLLTGDTERDELTEYADEVGDVDVVKLGHHGSRASVSEEALDVLRPELAVASAGEGNRYGHPDPACVHIVETSGAQFLCTKDDGDIHLLPGDPHPRYRVSR